MATLTPTQPEIMISVIRSEFEEMPGLHLTRQQFARLWNLDGTECERIIDELVADGFLTADSKGQLHRTHSDPVRRPILPGRRLSSRNAAGR